MSDPLQPVTKPASRSWISGRAAPQEYWAWAFSVVVLSVAMGVFLPENKLSGALTVVLILFQVRRLHDAGRTGWWVLAAQCASLIFVPLLWVYPTLAFSLGGLAELVGLIWIGLLRQDPGENRFGPPPGRKPVADTFS